VGVEKLFDHVVDIGAVIGELHLGRVQLPARFVSEDLGAI